MFEKRTIVACFILLFFLLSGFAHATTISDCSNLNASNTYYALDTDIPSSPWNICMNVTASNTTLDCNYHFIDGTGAAGSYGVFVNLTPSFTMLNCNVTDWNRGVFVNGSNNTNISYSNFSTNTYGIRLNASNNTIIQDGILNWSQTANIYLGAANDYITIRRNLISDTNGIVFSGEYPIINSPHTILIEYNNFASLDLVISYAISVGGNYSNSIIRHNTFDMGDTFTYGIGNAVLFNADDSANTYPATIYNNTFIGSSLGAGNYMISLGTGFTAVIYPPAGVNISNNLFNGVDGAVYFVSLLSYQSSPTNIFYQNTINGTYDGIFINNAGNQTLQNNIFNNTRRYALYLFANSSGTTSTNDVIINTNSSIKGDIVIGDFDYAGATSGNSITFLNTSFNKSAVVFNENDVGSNLTVKWFADVHVINSTADIASANVNISNSINATMFYEEFNLTTNATGWNSTTVTEYWQNISGIFNYTPHNFTASKDGYLNNNTNFNVTKSSIYTIVLGGSAPSSSLNLSFVSPTLADGNVSGDSGNNWIYVNVSYQNSTAIDKEILNWNGTNETGIMDCSSGYNCFINKTVLNWGNYSFYVWMNLTDAASNQTETRWNYLDICGTLTANRTLLTNVSGSATCMVVAANNVTLDCKSNAIDGVGTAGTKGIQLNSVTNFTMTNCTVSDWNYGLFNDGSLSTTVEYNNFSNNSQGQTVGIYSQGLNTAMLVYNNSFTNITSVDFTAVGPTLSLNFSENYLYGTGYGIYADGLGSINNSIFYHNTFYGGQFYLYGQNTTLDCAGAIMDGSISNTLSGRSDIFFPHGNITVKNCIIRYNGKYGIDVDWDGNSTITNNTVSHMAQNYSYGIVGVGNSSNFSYNTVINSTAGSLSYCISLDHVVNSTFHDNNMLDCYTGLAIVGPADNSNYYNNIINNTNTSFVLRGNPPASFLIQGSPSRFALNNVFYNNIINNSAQYALRFTAYTYNTTWRDGVISSLPGAEDVAFSGDANSLTFVNMSFNKSALEFGGTNNNLTVKWYVNFSVVENDSTTPIPNASVDVSNSLNTSVLYEALNLTTDASGNTSQQNVTEFFGDVTGVYNLTPHYITGRKSGYMTNATQNNVVSQGSPVSGVYVFTVMLTSTAPYNVSILTPGNDTWASQLYLNVTGICNSSTLPFINVTLNYNGTLVANTSPVTNATPFYFNQSVPSDGYYYYNLSCYTNNSLYTPSSTNLLKVDSVAPNVTINQPANGSSYYDNTSLTINVTAGDSLSGLDKAVANDSVWTGVFSASGNAFNLTNSSALTAGTHCIAVTVNDSANNVNSSYVCITAVAHIMTISNVHLIDVTQNTVTIGWDTSPAANEVLEYGLDTTYGSSYSNAAFATTHSAYINSLTTATVYHYRITSCSSSNICASTSDGTFTTAGGSGGGTGGGNSGGYIPTPTPTITPSVVASPSASVAPTAQPSLIGGDKDAHGCLIAAGYSWCEAKQKCLRTWEEPCVAASASPSATAAVVSQPAPVSGSISQWLILLLVLILLLLAFFLYKRRKKKRGL